MEKRSNQDTKLLHVDDFKQVCAEVYPFKSILSPLRTKKGTK